MGILTMIPFIAAYCIVIGIFASSYSLSKTPIGEKKRMITVKEAWMSLFWPIYIYIVFEYIIKHSFGLYISLARIINNNIIPFIFALFSYDYKNSKLYSDTDESIRKMGE